MQSMKLICRNPQVTKFLDNKIPVAHPTLYPYSCIVFIKVKLSASDRWGRPRKDRYKYGAGVLVSDYTVLTSGDLFREIAHNDFLIDDAPDAIEIMPMGTNGKLGKYSWREVRAINGGESSSNFALISLPQPVGFSTGFLSAEMNFPSDSAPHSLNKFFNIGFLDESGKRMFFSQGEVLSHHAKCEFMFLDGLPPRPEKFYLYNSRLIRGPLLLNLSSHEHIVKVIGSHTLNGLMHNFVPAINLLNPADSWFTHLKNYFGLRNPDDRFSMKAHGVSLLPNTRLPNYSIVEQEFSVADLNDMAGIRSSL